MTKEGREMNFIRPIYKRAHPENAQAEQILLEKNPSVQMLEYFGKIIVFRKFHTILNCAMYVQCGGYTVDKEMYKFYLI